MTSEEIKKVVGSTPNIENIKLDMKFVDYDDSDEDNIKEKEVHFIYKTDVVGYIRAQIDYYTYFIGEDIAPSNYMIKLFGCILIYALLVIETVMFLYQYMKRVIKLAFYTMISPLIAMLYPMDTIGDGRAQTFNMWFKEYIFNILIQPLHLLIYTIFMGAGAELLSRNLVYAIIIFMYMISAEKFFKKMFGFDKAGGSAPGLASPAASMLAMRGLDSLGKRGPHGAGKDKSGGKQKNTTERAKIPRATRSLAEGLGGNGVPSSGGGNGVPSSGGGNGVPSSGGRKNGGRKVGSRTVLGGGIKSLGNGFARRITGGASPTMGTVFTGRGLAGIGKNVGGKVVKKAVRTGSGIAGGIIGAGLGLGAGILSGAMASALSGEDKLAESMKTGLMRRSICWFWKSKLYG